MGNTQEVALSQHKKRCVGNGHRSSIGDDNVNPSNRQQGDQGDDEGVYSKEVGQ